LDGVITFNTKAAQEYQMDSLVRKLENARDGSLKLDADFKAVFPSAPSNVTRSIDAVVQLIEAELPGWWWTCGYCTASHDASLYAPGSSQYPYCSSATVGPDGKAGPEARRLLNDPRWGKIFDDGFHIDLRGGTIPLAMLRVFLEAKITLEQAHREGLQPLSSVKRVRSLIERLSEGEDMTEPTRVALEKMKKAALTEDELGLIILHEARFGSIAVKRSASTACPEPVVDAKPPRRRVSHQRLVASALLRVDCLRILGRATAREGEILRAPRPKARLVVEFYFCRAARNSFACTNSGRFGSAVFHMVKNS
jgi:hypothetical protein